MSEERTITLYLASWQKRMIKDYMKANARRLGFVNPYDNLGKMSLRVPDRTWVMYKLPDPGAFLDGAIHIYLTDEQITQVVEATGLKIKIAAVTITPAMIKDNLVNFG